MRHFALKAVLLLGLLPSLLPAQDYSWTNFVGMGRVGGSGNTDGTGSAARFNLPRGVAVDGSGNLYVADYNNHTIRKVTPAGVVTTLAGSAGSPGSADGTGSAARFNGPSGVAVDGSGNLYVADRSNHTIRKVTPAGVVTTLAGSAESSGAANGTGSTARFNGPLSVAVDGSGNLYVTDYNNHTIRKVTPAGVVTTHAGSAGNPGSANGTGSFARFRYPVGVAVDSSGNLYVADTYNHTIRKVTPARVVTTLAGSAGNLGGADGTDRDARFNHPRGVALDGSGNLYVTDSYGRTIRKVTPAGVVTTLAGDFFIWGNADGTGSAARFRFLYGVVVDSNGNLYVADRDNHTIRKVTSDATVTTLAGLAERGSGDGTGSAARFDRPMGVAADGSGNLYVADTYNNTIRKVTPTGVVTTLAGSGYSSTTDGTGSEARFFYPYGVAVDGSGNVYVAGFNDNAIRKVTPSGVVTTLAGGGAYNEGSANGTGSAARFDRPSGVAVDAVGNVYVADTMNHTIRKVTPAGVVTTLAGRAGHRGSADGTGSAARFYEPEDVAVDDRGNVYVADTFNYTIRKVTPGGVVTTLAGRAENRGESDGDYHKDGKGSAARFNYPRGVAVDGSGNLYVADGSTIRKITPARVVTTIGGLAHVPGSADGTGSAARFTYPRGVAVDGSGNVYVADMWNHRISRGVAVPELPQVTTATPGGITHSAAVLGGHVVADGWAAVTERGVVFATTPEPAIGAGIQVVSGSGKGHYIANLSDLSAGTTYYARAYAINSAGTAYGEEVSFTTNAGPSASQRYQLTLVSSVPKALAAAPDKAGVLALSATPSKDATKLSQGPAPQSSQILPGTQVKVTATAKAGHFFKQWEGLPNDAQELGNVTAFPMPEGNITLTAVFIANPFTVPPWEGGTPSPLLALGAKPVFQGLLLPDSETETTAGNTTVGLFTATLVAAKGSLSGKVFLDGKTTSCTGQLQGDGSVWFKTGKTFNSALTLLDGAATGKTLSATWSEAGLQATVSAPGGNVSAGLAKPKLAAAPAELLNRKGKSGYLTLALPAREPAAPEDAATYPQGTGYATLTLAKTGALKLSGVLADGTKITASSLLVAGDASPVFIPLRTPGGKASEKDGSFSGDLVFDVTAEDSDVGGADWWWFRPAAVTQAETLQAYRAGWPEGIFLDPVGALYDAAKPAQTALDLGDADAAAGNAVLEFADGKLDSDVLVAAFNIEGSKVVKVDKKDTSFTLSVAAKTGLIKGTFTPEWVAPLERAKKLPAFQGVLLQKGGNRAGWGFFLSNSANDLNPESGEVMLSGP